MLVRVNKNGDYVNTDHIVSIRRSGLENMACIICTLDGKIIEVAASTDEVAKRLRLTADEHLEDRNVYGDKVVETVNF